jgi:hypothetical protein
MTAAGCWLYRDVLFYVCRRGVGRRICGTWPMKRVNSNAARFAGDPDDNLNRLFNNVELGTKGILSSVEHAVLHEKEGGPSGATRIAQILPSLERALRDGNAGLAGPRVGVE